MGSELNLRQPEVTTLYCESCKLTELESVFRAYEELKGDIEPFVKLYRLAKAAGMNVQDVNNLLTIAMVAKQVFGVYQIRLNSNGRCSIV